MEMAGYPQTIWALMFYAKFWKVSWFQSPWQLRKLQKVAAVGQIVCHINAQP